MVELLAGQSALVVQVALAEPAAALGNVSNRVLHRRNRLRRSRSPRNLVVLPPIVDGKDTCHENNES